MSLVALRGMIGVGIPALPEPIAIRREIDSLRAQITELKALLPLSRAQHAAKNIGNARRGIERADTTGQAPEVIADA